MNNGNRWIRSSLLGRLDSNKTVNRRPSNELSGGEGRVVVEEASCKNSISTPSRSEVVPFPKEPCKILLSREFEYS